MVVGGTKAKYEKKLLRLSTLKSNSNDLPTNISSQSCNQHLLYDLSFILQTVIDKVICVKIVENFIRFYISSKRLLLKQYIYVDVIT